MKKYIINADPRVKDDLLEARDFFNSRKKGLGLEFLKDYRTALSKLTINPFYEIRYGTIRCLPLETFPFMIHFTVDEIKNTVLVLAVISTHKDPKTNWI
jgi:hypothetical protein